MKLWEVMRLLEENPKDQYEAYLIGGFKCVMSVNLSSTIGNYYRLDIFNERGALIPQELGGGAFNGNLNLNLDWQKTLREVDWIEALMHCYSGGRIWVKSNLSNMTNDYGEQDNITINKDKIENGKWYIL